MSDVAYGTSSYVQELADELKKQGLIDDTSTIQHVEDVLNAIQDSSGNAASLFDTPPLSVDQLDAVQQVRQVEAGAAGDGEAQAADPAQALEVRHEHVEAQRG